MTRCARRGCQPQHARARVLPGMGAPVSINHQPNRRQPLHLAPLARLDSRLQIFKEQASERHTPEITTLCQQSQTHARGARNTSFTDGRDGSPSRPEFVGARAVASASRPYRFAWAERAKTCGYPERFDQEALGHNSNAVHRAYARKAQVVIPTLEGITEETCSSRTRDRADAGFLRALRALRGEEAF